MSAITDIKCALTWKALDVFCTKYHIPEEVHPVLPNQNDTMHERPAGKIGLYTRFFDYANFRLPLSTFLVDILRHFRINISQLSVIGAAKVSHFEILCRVYGIIPTVGLFRCFYVNSKKNGWMSFSKRSDNAPITLLCPSPFRKFPEAFMCLVGLSRYYPLDEETYPRFLHKNGEDMDIFVFIYTPDPTKVKIVERERNDDEPLFLQTTVGSGRGADIQLVSEATNTVAEDVAPLQPRRQRKRKTVVVDAGEASHPPKKLREDHGTPSRPSVAGKSRSAVQRLLAGAVLNPDVGVAAMPTLPFITSSVSATPEHEGEDHTNSVTGLNLRTIGASQRFVISSDSSHHSGTNVAEAEVDSLIRSSVPIMTIVTTVTSTVDPAAVAKEKPVEPSLFGAASSSAGGTDPTPGGFSDRTGSDFLVGGIRTVIDPDTNLQKTYVPRWSVTNGSCLDDGRICRDMVDEFAPPKFFVSIRGMEHDQLFTEFNVRAARQMSLSAEVRMRAECNIKEKRRLKSVVNEQAELLKAREDEIKNLKAQLLLKEAEAAKAICLRAEASKFKAVTDLAASVAVREREVADLDTLVHELEVSSSRLQEKVTVYEDCMGQLKKFQDNRMKEVNDKFDKLYADFIEMALYFKERFYPHLLTTIYDRRSLLTEGVELAITKCLNSPKYLSALGAAIGKAIEKGMQDELSAGITNGKEGMLQNVNFPLLVELKSNKDASIEAVIYDKVVIGATALSLALDVSNISVQKIKENIANPRSFLHNVFVPLFEPLSAAVLTCTEGTSDTVLATADTTMALSTTFSSVSIIAPIFVDDYEVVGTDDQAGADGNVEPFPNVDHAELNIP
ncbi:hypothetical protein Tco_0526879 [Tanacetum coccineum]